MPGFPGLAIGAGLGQFAQDYRQQQQAQNANMMLRLTLQRFAQEQQDRRDQEAEAGAGWDARLAGALPGNSVLPGTTSAVPPPMPSSPSGGGAGGGGGQFWTPAGISAVQPTEGRWDQVHYPSGYTRSGVKSSASGGLGYIDSTWREFAPKAGVDLAQYPRAYMAPEDVQRKVASITPISNWTGTDSSGKPFNAAAQRLAANPAYVTGGGGGGLAKGFARSPQGDLTRNGQPPDASFGEGTPAWKVPEQQTAQAGPQTATDAGAPDIEAQIAKIPMPQLPSPNGTDLRPLMQQIMAADPYGTKKRWQATLEKQIKIMAPEQAHQFQVELKRYEGQIKQRDEQVAAMREQARHVRDRGEKVHDLETAPGPLIQRGDATWQVNQRRGTAAPITVEGTGEPLTDAQRLGGGNRSAQSSDRARFVHEEALRLNEEFDAANPNADAATRRAEHSANYLKAERKLASATTKDARSASGMTMRKFLTEHPDASSGDMQQFIANQTGMSASQRVIAQRGTSLEIASNVAEETIPLLRETSHRINRTEFPTLNSVLLAVEQGTGNTDVVRFSEQLNSFQYLYARALNPNGIPRIEDMRRLEGIVAKNWTSGQLDAALDQVGIGLLAEKRGVEKTRESHSGAAPATPAASTPAAGGQDVVPLPPAYASALDGTSYKNDKDGTMWVKRGNQLIKTPDAVPTATPGAM